MPEQIEHFNLALPDGLPLKDFMHGHRCGMFRSATVQLLNSSFKPR